MAQYREFAFSVDGLPTYDVDLNPTLQTERLSYIIAEALLGVEDFSLMSFGGDESPGLESYFFSNKHLWQEEQRDAIVSMQEGLNIASIENVSGISDILVAIESLRDSVSLLQQAIAPVDSETQEVYPLRETMGIYDIRNPLENMQDTLISLQRTLAPTDNNGENISLGDLLRLEEIVSELEGIQNSVLRLQQAIAPVDSETQEVLPLKETLGIDAALSDIAAASGVTIDAPGLTVLRGMNVVNGSLE